MMGRDTRVIDNLCEWIEALRTHTGEIVLYGAGMCGSQTLMVLRRAGIRVAAFCDGNPAKAGTLCHNIPVISLAQLKERKNTMVITSVASATIPSACKSLLGAGIAPVYAVALAEFNLRQLNLPPESLPQELDVAGEARILYPLLADEVSRVTFTAYLYASLSGDEAACAVLPEAVCPVCTELTLEGEKLELFRRQVRSARKTCLRWTHTEAGRGWLEAMVELYDMGYRRFWLCPQAGQLQMGAEKV